MTSVEKVLLLLDSLSMPYKVLKFVSEQKEEDVFNVENIKKDILKNFDEGIYFKLKNAIFAENVDKNLLKMQKFGVEAITILDKKYPNKLREISSAPIILYYIGDISLLNKKSIAIVGTRKPTAYGREVTRYFASNLSKAGLVTISGLAYGLDMEVANSTIDVNGKTIGILGGGLDRIYPSQNTELAKKIVQTGGLLLSLYPPLRRPTKYSFIDRNRVITALSLGTIICEAGESSGTLNTANHAIEQGRELFVVPANIFSIASKGSNELINQMPDTCTINYEHVLRTLHIESRQEKDDKEKIKQLSINEELVVKALYECDLDFDGLLEKTKLDSKTLISLLTMMEISGLIKKLPSNFYTL